MPVWKKAKGNRFSQLVADHLQSPKHGGSLVVETGFPTSLIDLFVKNRDRLKKPSKKKRFEPIPDTTPIPDRPSSPSSSTRGTQPRPNSPLFSPISTPPRLQPPPNSGLVLPSVSVSASGYATPPRRCSSGRLGNEFDVIQESGDGKDGGGGEVADVNRVFVAILKMFFVVALALGTKRFVVGITMSAFLLLFMEYAGKHLCLLLKPCADAQMSLQSLVERGLCFVGIKRDNKLIIIKEDRGLKARIVQEGTSPVVSDRFGWIEGHNKTNDPIREIQVVQSDPILGCSRLVEGHQVNDPIQEIQVEEPSVNLVPSSGEIQIVKYEFDSRSSEEKRVCEEMGKKEVMEKEEAYVVCDVVDLKGGRTRSGRIRSKIKKLVPKKLRCSKKKQLELKNEAIVMGEDKEHLDDGERSGLEYDEKSWSLSSGANGDQVDVGDEIWNSSEISRADMEDSIVREDNIGTETKRNSGYIVLIVIVLVGLFGGRVLALAFALSWYLLLKLAGIHQRFIKGSPNEEVSISS